MYNVLLIGYGNPLRGDDGVGPCAAELLAQTLPDTVEALTPHQLLPELAEPISRADLVVFIDAAVGDTPGQVASMPVTPLPSARAFSHQCDPAGLLAAAAALYGRSPEAYLVTITGASFGYEERLSESILNTLNEVISHVQNLITNGRSITSNE